MSSLSGLSTPPLASGLDIGCIRPRLHPQGSHELIEKVFLVVGASGGKWSGPDIVKRHLDRTILGGRYLTHAHSFPSVSMTSPRSRLERRYGEPWLPDLTEPPTLCTHNGLDPEARERVEIGVTV